MKSDFLKHSGCRPGFLGGSVVKNPPAMQELQEIWVQSLGRDDPLEEGMATHPAFLLGEFHGQRSLASLFYLLHWEAGSLPLVPPGKPDNTLIWLYKIMFSSNLRSVYSETLKVAYFWWVKLKPVGNYNCLLFSSFQFFYHKYVSLIAVKKSLKFSFK